MVLKFGRLVGMHRRLELLAEFIDPRRVVVLHRPQLARHVNSRRHMLRLLEGPQHLIDHRRDLLVCIDLAHTGPAVRGKRSLGDHDPVPVAELRGLHRQSVPPSLVLRHEAASRHHERGENQATVEPGKHPRE